MCQKKQYTKVEAQGALNVMLANHSASTGRVYECEECNAWHVTSIAQEWYDDYSNRGSRKIKMQNEFKKYIQ